MSQRYMVSHNEVALQQFREIVARAKREGRLKNVLEAGKALLEQLSIDPYFHSETRGFYLFLRIFKRVSIVSPLTVFFAVDEATRLVTIVGFVLHDNRKI